MTADTTTLDPIQLLITQAGIAGVFIALILIGWLWPKLAVMREFDRADAKDKQQQALIASLLEDQKDVLPLLMEVDKRLIPLLESTTALLKRMEGLLDRVEREWEWRERRGRAAEETPYGGSGRDYGDRRGSGGREGSGPGDHPQGEVGTR